MDPDSDVEVKRAVRVKDQGKVTGGKQRDTNQVGHGYRAINAGTEQPGKLQNYSFYSAEQIEVNITINT
jgi:hypothetical protein